MMVRCGCPATLSLGRRPAFDPDRAFLDMGALELRPVSSSSHAAVMPFFSDGSGVHSSALPSSRCGPPLPDLLHLLL